MSETEPHAPDATGRLVCPRCGARKGFRLVARQEGRLGPVATGCLATMFGALLIPFLVRQSGLELMTQCRSCGRLFHSPEPTSRWAWAALGVIVIVILLLTVGYILFVAD